MLRIIGPYAFHKGNTYGTILVDLEQRKVIDLLADREGETLHLENPENSLPTVPEKTLPVHPENE